MAWGKVDDKLHSSVKWRSASKPARALWSTGLSWCMDQLTDGFVPRDMLPVLDGTRAEAASLVRAGLWEEVDGGYLYHDWLDYQPSREQVLAERAAAAERQRRAREKAKETRASRGSHAVTHAVTHGEVTPVVTVPPTRPDPTRSLGLLSVVGDGSPQDQIVTHVSRERRTVGLGGER